MSERFQIEVTDGTETISVIGKVYVDPSDVRSWVQLYCNKSHCRSARETVKAMVKRFHNLAESSWSKPEGGRTWTVGEVVTMGGHFEFDTTTGKLRNI